MRCICVLQARDHLNPLLDADVMVLSRIRGGNRCTSTLHHALILNLILVDPQRLDMRPVVVGKVERELDYFLVALLTVRKQLAQSLLRLDDPEKPLE